MKYTLINPVIGGAFKTTVSASNETEAMHELWKNLSGHLTNNVKTFYATVMKGGDPASSSSFQITESTNGKYADYEITPVAKKLSSSTASKLMSRLKSIQDKEDKQDGGKRRSRYNNIDSDDDSDSSSSEDEALYKKFRKFKSINRRPITYFWYSPLIYDVPTVYVPTFIAPLAPFVEINLSSAFFD